MPIFVIKIFEAVNVCQNQIESCIFAARQVNLLFKKALEVAMIIYLC